MQNDDDIARVMRAAGPREKPPAEIERALRESLRGEWRAVVAERQGRRRRAALALAAGVMAAAVGTWFVVADVGEPAQAVGSVALADGVLRVKTGRFGRWEPASGGQPVAIGQFLATGPTGRGALELAGGISARLDHETEVRVAAADRLVIDRGAIYVDAGADSAGAAPLEIVTPAGSVRHLGTQYEVRVTDSAVRLRVREGRVLWNSDAGTATGEAGEQLTIAPGGGVERGRVPLFGETWDWAAAAAPAIELDGLPLGEFLDWAARELGRRVEYATPEVARQAASVVLRGSIAGLTPDEALATVLATTRMQAVLEEGRILVNARH
jgi:ferric-dicitrate binding protein FerR (iron transport regulator)